MKLTMKRAENKKNLLGHGAYGVAFTQS